MTRPMATWVIIAALATIGVTALLIGVLYRLNAPVVKRPEGGGVGTDPGNPRPADNGGSDLSGGGD
jgi:hypothetical protein